MNEIERLAHILADSRVYEGYETKTRLRLLMHQMPNAIRDVRAILTAMREPSEEMLNLICCSMDRDGWRAHALQAWEVSIDHILNQDEGLGHHGPKDRDRA